MGVGQGPAQGPPEMPHRCQEPYGTRQSVQAEGASTCPPKPQAEAGGERQGLISKRQTYKEVNKNAKKHACQRNPFLKSRLAKSLLSALVGCHQSRLFLTTGPLAFLKNSIFFCGVSWVQ